MAITAPLATNEVAMGMGKMAEEPARVGETNVQVVGIDEPDILKNDGKDIYFSGNPVYWRNFVSPVLAPSIEIEGEDAPGRTVPAPDELPQRSQQATKILEAFPPAELKQLSGIEDQGNLLLNGEELLVFLYNKIVGYDISDPSTPKKLWTFELDSRSSVVSARLYKGVVYIVSQASVSSYQPCPIPLRVGDKTLTVECNEIFHPVAPIPANATYTVFSLDTRSGEVEKSISFVGASGQSVVYMSENGVYVTYPSTVDTIGFISDFFATAGKGLLPSTILSRLEGLKNLDISSEAKMVELQKLMQDFELSLSSDDKLKLENEMSNKMEQYLKDHLRDLTRTGLVRVGLGDFSIAATGFVPGYPLNQFSIDEYEGNLRIAVTLEGGMWGGGAASENDVYVLDSGLKVIGSVQGMGITERVYSARFVGDRGYVVTFRQIDPFYVLDLADPKNPKLAGELKIPGYSSYLHPISEGVILGVGEEGSQVKLSLFGVTNPYNPTEISKYMLDEYYSEIAQTHHAFLQDDKHKIFFMPGGKGGYIFSYEGDQLSLKRAVSGITARRATFINDYLYIVGDDKIVVLNETDWEEVNRLVF
jgi:uncharacterized secreted protein with C-terminal beta-propeller domain